MREAQPRRFGHDLGDDPLVDRRIPDDPAGADVVAAGMGTL